jgi:hypothetical protein
VGRACGTHGRWEKRVQVFLMGNTEGKRPLGRPRRRWENGIRMDLRKFAWGWGCGVYSPGAGCCECGDESSGSGATELVCWYLLTRRVSTLRMTSLDVSTMRG